MPLAFFNTGTSAGGAIPFQRVVEPQQLGMFLNLEQAELLRIQRYNEGWRFYFGKHWLFTRSDGEPLVTVNYFRKIIDKSVSFLVGKSFTVQVPEAVEQVTKPFIDEVWKYNKRDMFAYDSATMGAVTGDVFVLITSEQPSIMQRRINPYSKGRIRINLLGSEQVFPSWDPVDMDTMTSARIETIYYAERGVDNPAVDGRQIVTRRFTQTITADRIIKQYHGQMPVIEANRLGEIPVVHIKNMPIPREYYGLPDGLDVVDLQREYNEKSTDISDSINYHSSPVTVVFGAKAKQLQRGAKQVWSGLPTDARVETLKLEGDMTAAVNYLDRVKKSIHEVSDIPEGTLGTMQPISNTSGVALHTQYQPLIEKTARKRTMYKDGFEQINYFILRIGMSLGQLYVPFDLCKSCGGRIVEVINPNKTQPMWNVETESYDQVPVREKKCYHIDKQTLEFNEPDDMRIKFWRNYGFGRELREMRFKDIKVEMQREGSFWDYTKLLDALKSDFARRWVQQNPHLFPEPVDVLPDGRVVGLPRPPQQPQVDAMGNDMPLPDQTMGPDGNPAAPSQVPYPEWMQQDIIPEEEIDIPEEPEHVLVVNTLVHPESGQIVGEELTEKFIVPTGCRNPQYLNPFETDVSFQDVLPKDRAMEAQLFAQYQENGWTDAYWAQEQIPEIAESVAEIRKRMKSAANAPGMQPGVAPGQVANQPQPMSNPFETQLSPTATPAASVPGLRGNPTLLTQQPM